MAKLRFQFPTFRQPPAVTYGRGSLRVLADEVPLEGTALLVSGQPRVQEALRGVYEKRGLDWSAAQVWIKPAGEPTWESIAQAAEFLAQVRPTRLVAVGGGSLLDGARLAWFAAQGALDLSGGRVTLREPAGPRAEFWMVPTTCATGAEGATVAVFSHQGQKLPVVSPQLLADRVVLDAQFLEGLSPGQLATFLCDVLSHAIESYVSMVPGSLPRESAAAALHLVLTHWPAEPTASRLERLMEAGYLAGLAAGHLSVGVVHAFAHSAARLGLGHALANALALPAGLAANRQAPRLAELARRVGRVDADRLIEAVTEICRVAVAGQTAEGLAAALADPAARSALRQRMAADPCLRTNPHPLATDDLDQFLQRVDEALAPR